MELEHIGTQCSSCSCVLRQAQLEGLVLARCDEAPLTDWWLLRPARGLSEPSETPAHAWTRHATLEDYVQRYARCVHSSRRGGLFPYLRSALPPAPSPAPHVRVYANGVYDATARALYAFDAAPAHLVAGSSTLEAWVPFTRPTPALDAFIAPTNPSRHEVLALLGRALWPVGSDAWNIAPLLVGPGATTIKHVLEWFVPPDAQGHGPVRTSPHRSPLFGLHYKQLCFIEADAAQEALPDLSWMIGGHNIGMTEGRLGHAATVVHWTAALVLRATDLRSVHPHYAQDPSIARKLKVLQFDSPPPHVTYSALREEASAIFEAVTRAYTSCRHTAAHTFATPSLFDAAAAWARAGADEDNGMHDLTSAFAATRVA